MPNVSLTNCTCLPACVTMPVMASNTINHRRFSKLDRRYKQPVRTEFYEEHLDALNSLIEQTGLTVAEILRRMVLIAQPEQLRNYESIRNEFRVPTWTCACDKPQYSQYCADCQLNMLDMTNPEFNLDWYKANMQKLKSEGKWNVA